MLYHHMTLCRRRKLIHVEHAQKYYGSSRGIEDASLHVFSGEIFGFVDLMVQVKQR